MDWMDNRLELGVVEVLKKLINLLMKEFLEESLNRKVLGIMLRGLVMFDFFSLLLVLMNVDVS